MILPLQEPPDLKLISDSLLQLEIQFCMLAAECCSEGEYASYYEARLSRAESELERRYLLS